MLASMSVPIATTATWKSFAPSCSSAFRVGGVHLHGMGQPPECVLHDVGLGIDPQHLVAELDQRVGECAAEATEADDDDLAARRRHRRDGGHRSAPEGEAVFSSQ
jgi:hypothetical protein